MATAEVRSPSAAGPSPAIRHPLERLRASIRRYVLLEGLAVIGIVLALWFWIGLLLDFGVFKVFHFDWVQEAPRGLRAAVLIAVTVAVLGIVAVKIVRRLLVEFSPAALALVLERRFHDVLGDRLITAVELADWKRAEEQGYSRAMIEQTAQDAELRMRNVPIDQVFDWRRLRRLTGWFIALTLGIFVVVGATYSLATRTNPLSDFAVRFYDTASIWVERNVLLWNTIWPRNAYVELLDFPMSGDLRVGRDSAATRLRVRGIKWLIADKKAPEGWRAMTWKDLSDGSWGVSLPPSYGSPAIFAESRLDQVQRDIDRPESTFKPEDRQSLANLFQQLAERAGEPGMGRRLRMLEVPPRVEVVTWGEKTSNETPMPLGSDQEYSGTLSDLKESVKFRIRAGDYSTSVRSITLVPPPMLTALTRNEWRPAYIYLRPPIDGGIAGLKGLRQTLTDQAVSLSGPVSQISVPAGTDVELLGDLDKDLTEVLMIPIARKGEESDPPSQLKLAADKHSFSQRFENVQTPIDFELEFIDTDNVRSRRHVLIEAVRDSVPSVNVTIDGIRKTNAGYMVTPMAMIPFAGTITDTYGIASAEYAATVVRLETSAVVGVQASAVVGNVLQFAPSDLASAISGAVGLTEVRRFLAAGSPEPKPYAFPLKSLEEVVKERAARDVVLEELKRRLEQPPGQNAHVLQFEVKPKFEFLDLRERLPELKVKDEQTLQPRYRMKLTVNASDFNVESGPGVGTNKEPPFTVLIVSEAELLVEIANDERNQHFKMEDTIGRLKDARLRLDKIVEELPGLDAAKIGTMALRAQEILDTLLKGRDTTQEVLNEYTRLLREMELNRVMPKLVTKVQGEIVFPLEGALRTEFVQAEETGEQFRKELAAGQKPAADSLKLALDRLIDRLNKVMDAMGEIKGINDLITALRAIEKAQEQDIGGVLRRIKKEKEDELFRRIGALQ